MAKSVVDRRAFHVYVGMALRLFRIRERLTQSELGEKLGKSTREGGQSYVSRIESGSLEAPIGVVAEICGYLNCRVSEVMDRAEQIAMSDQCDSESALFESLRSKSLGLNTGAISDLEREFCDATERRVVRECLDRLTAKVHDGSLDVNDVEVLHEIDDVDAIDVRQLITLVHTLVLRLESDEKKDAELEELRTLRACLN